MTQPNKNIGMGRVRTTKTLVRRWTRVISVAVPVTCVMGWQAPALAQGSDLTEVLALVHAGNPTNRIDGLSIEELDDGTTVLHLQGSAEPTFNVYRLDDPDRLVVDIASSERGDAVPEVPVDTWSVGRVTLTSVAEKGSKQARLVVELKRDSSYIVVPSEGELVVTITPREVAPTAYFAEKSAGVRKAEIERLESDAKARVAALEARAKQAETRASKAEKKAQAQAKSGKHAPNRAERRALMAKKRSAIKKQKAAQREERRAERVARRAKDSKAQKLAARKLKEARSMRTQADATLARANKALEIGEKKLAELEKARTAALLARKTAEDARKDLEKQLESAVAEKERAREQLAEERKLTQKQRDELHALKQDAERDLKSANARVASVSKRLKQAEDKNKASAGELEELRKAKEEADRARTVAEAARKKLEADAKEREASAKKMLADAEKAMKAAKDAHEAAAQAKQDAQSALAKAEKARKRKPRSKQAEAKLAAARKAAKQAKARELEAQDNLKDLKADHTKLEKLLAKRRKTSQELEKKIAAKRGELDDLEKRVAKAEAKVESLGGAVTAADVKRAEKDAAQAKLLTSVLSKEVERLRREADAANAKAEKAEETKSKAESKEAKRLREEADKARDKLAAKERTLKRVQGELEDKTTEVAALTKKHESLKSKSAKLQKENAKARDELASVNAELEKVRGSIDKERAKLKGVEKQVEAAEGNLAQAVAKTDETFAKKQKSKSVTTVADVRFEDTPTESRVIIDVEGPLVYSGHSMSPRVKVIELDRASIPKRLERSLDTSGFDSPVGMVSSFEEDGKVKVLVATNDNNPPELEEKPGQLVLKFARGGSYEAGESEVVSLAAPKVGGFVTPPVTAFAFGNETFGKTNRKWRGERIDIELQDAPIKDVLLLFSDIGHVNIIAGDGVEGTVTMRLTSVPWDQALDIILRSLGLGSVQEGNVIRVATQSQLEEERAKAIEQANAQVQLKPLQTKLIPLSYATVSEMMPKVQSVLSSRGSVTPDSRTNTLIVMDVAENIALAEQLVGSLDSQTPQVLIEARIVEARTTWLRQLGIQWGFDYTASAGTGNPTGLFFPNSVGVGGGSGGAQQNTNGLILPAAAQNPNYAVDLPAPVATGTGGAIGFSFGSINGNLNTNLRLSAAEDEGEVRIISAPKIVTLDNTEARIEDGVQIPISQVSAQGVNTRYVNATLALQVTPHVTNEGAVLLDVSVQKNEADFVNTGARGDPTILTKNAQSQMLITDGDTAVIGGIYTRNRSVNRKKIPWIADVPIIGWFFKNKTEVDNRNEVLIFLTPKIVNRSTSIGG